jgi:hypothetical protein
MKLAQAGTINLNIPSGSQFSNLSNISISGLIAAFIVIILIIVSIILVFILIGGGIAYMMGGARGDTQAMGRGRSAITGALVGLVIVFGAWAIITLINAFFGINILNLNIPVASG